MRLKAFKVVVWPKVISLTYLLKSQSEHGSPPSNQSLSSMSPRQDTLKVFLLPQIFYQAAVLAHAPTQQLRIFDL